MLTLVIDRSIDKFSANDLFNALSSITLREEEETLYHQTAANLPHQTPLMAGG